MTESIQSNTQRVGPILAVPLLSAILTATFSRAWIIFASLLAARGGYFPGFFRSHNGHFMNPDTNYQKKKKKNPDIISWLQVTRVMARMASADIMCVESKAVKEKFTGIIRQQDVRATEIDKVDMYLSFRPGDIVRALVLSLGDARAYYLSTAKNELGVVSAQSLTGATMVPISWTEMQCPLTGQVEKRKVATIE
ncbi:hypothetical protein AXF42_Ash006891 [Apostasia shenzhenica]|uniref:Exosome complex component CSL4 C-terminal domain-containing protein n=1 Tax=Apostasia shenzhenica TaxID=1088818 RepID=A0A2I0BEJ0_9ASPA|nr:hypothetical protein AXF42_Ash006891 [Apostasia shenzhenica]